ncbi:MAG TPA: uracil-DNA glycosylase [Xanthobacteraceae bacterium]|jgi:uracil-DNA glycosylase family 4|nr:uracil-DNA glycosylase [Xanthobacteraceae bacterium]
MIAEPSHNCPLCPRLAAFRKANRKAEPDWFNGPVAIFGSASAELLIVGLAPGLRGANRTGRPFTGDYAGDLLYATLKEFGFAHGEYQARPDDGLRLVNARIANAVRCVPPQNKPTPAEINTCRRFLAGAMEQTKEMQAIVALGKIAHDSVVRTLNGKLAHYKFAHGAKHEIAGYTLFDSYHCSRYNTNTGVLTPKMFRAVFADVKKYLEKK